MAFDHKHLIDITEYSADDIMTILETAKTLQAGQRAPHQEGAHAEGLHRREHVQRALHPHPLLLRDRREAPVRRQPELRRLLHGHGEGREPRGHREDAVLLQDRHASWCATSCAGVPRKIADVSGVPRHRRRRRQAPASHAGPARPVLHLGGEGRPSTTCTWASWATSGTPACAAALIPALKIMGCEVTVIAPPTLLPARPDVLGADHVTTQPRRGAARAGRGVHAAHPARAPRGRAVSQPARVQPALRPHRGARPAYEARRLRVPSRAPSTAAWNWTASWPTIRSAPSSSTRSTPASCVRMAALYLLLGGSERWH